MLCIQKKDKGSRIMPKMVAIVKQRYDGKNILVNEVFDVRDKDVRLLRALRRVKSMAAVKAMTAENESALVPNPVRRSHEHTAVGQQRESVVQNEPVVSDPGPIGDSVDNALNESASPNEESQTEYSKMLRDRARTIGIHIDGRWSDSRVQREIDEHFKKTYQRMDITATETKSE